MSKGNYSEDNLIEKPAIELFRSLGWEYIYCYDEFEQLGGSPLGRETKSDVVLLTRLRTALTNLNRKLPASAINLAIEELLRDRSVMTIIQANREIYKLLKEGVKVKVQDSESGEETDKLVQVIDWDNPENNDFLLVSQFWITGEMYTRRADLIGFVNGIPLVFIELKAIHRNIETAYRNNLTDYKDTIPHLFWYNGLIILSNGSRSIIGSVTANWEHFAEWKKINSEGEEGVVSLETILRGTCEKSRLLDLIENFTLFMEAKGGSIKLIAKNHQYLGVDNALIALRDIRNREGKLGVFWHTQGSGKSVSMIFLAQKVLRKFPGNWTFVIITDRKELDNQIYKNFVNSGAITEPETQADSSPHLRQLLQEDHRYVFTLIHKFRTKPGEKHPVLSPRSDIIVITDEAHRSQYDTLALNMRTALPNASFIAFTGTPLIVGEEKTRQVFGDYISIYNFKQSVDDGATVPLYYENRIPELQLKNENLNEDMEQLLEEAELDEEQEKKLEREFGREYHLITRSDRLDTIARDIVMHFTNRGFQGKAMVVCIDKATAVKMYDKVQTSWKEYIKVLKKDLEKTTETAKQAEIKDKLAYMQETDMAVVVSQAQNEINEMRKKGLDITPHRKRMVKEDLDTKFKDPDDKFRLVFVCAMWMTGFDAPACSTIYLDKPMRNHTLMQTIARANRVFRDKVNGLIVDYVGVFRNLQKALAIYGSGSGGGIKPGESPVADKSELINLLKKAITETTAFCTEHKINVTAIQNSEKLMRVKLLDDAVDAILVNDESKKKYLLLAGNVVKLYKAILPDPVAHQVYPTCILFNTLAKKIRSLMPIPDISEVMDSVEDLLDDSIKPDGYIIRSPIATYGKKDHLLDLSQIDFEGLRKKFEKSRKHIETERLRTTILTRLNQMVKLNRARIDYYDKFQELIEEYNSGSRNIDDLFGQLVHFAQSLNEEEKRGIAANLSEEELAVFDLLTKPDMQLKKAEENKVKKVVKNLLETLKREKLVLDWRKRQQTRADVKVSIEKILDELPECFIPEIYRKKCDLIYTHIYDSYYGQGQSIYTQG